MDLATFANQHSTPAPPLLEGLARATWQRTRHGRLMTDGHTGRVIAAISQMMQPRTILELGTFTGYGTLCLLEGLHPEGTLHTVERNDELFAVQDEFWQQAEGGHRIRRHHMDALDFLHQWDETRNGSIDLAYVDADKQNVNAQLDALLPMLSEHGSLLFDNTWWGGTLYSEEDGSAGTGAKADALRQLNERLMNDPDLRTVTLPVGDGLSLVRMA